MLLPCFRTREQWRRVPFHFFPIRQFLNRLLVSSLNKVSVSLGHRCVRVTDDFSDDVQVDPGVNHMGDESMRRSWKWKSLMLARRQAFSKDVRTS